jgi:uncharacterized repeat protein (TIGR03803 family)
MRKRSTFSSIQISFLLALAVVICTVQASAAQENGPLRYQEFPFNGNPNGLVMDAAGNMYGVAAGGAYGYGEIFRAVPDEVGDLTQTVLHSFTGGMDGGNPAGIVLDKEGNIYGLASLGGGKNLGVFYELSPSGHEQWKETILYNFTRTLIRDEPFPNAPSMDNAGNFFGQTYEWGGYGYGYGSIFEISPTQVGPWKFTLIHTFSGKAGGAAPFGSFVFDQAGNLYGTGAFGGSADGGVVFELTPATDGTWSESVLYNFAGGADGSFPSSGVVFDAAGNLFGTTGNGGSVSGCGFYGGCGTVFELSPSADGAWKESLLYTFGDIGPELGAGPSGLSLDNAGNLFGATYEGGSGRLCYDGCGTVFELSPMGNGQWFTMTLHSFTGSPGGQNPSGGVLLTSGGRLYGTTSLGGANGGFKGLVYELSGER